MGTEDVRSGNFFRFKFALHHPVIETPLGHHVQKIVKNPHWHRLILPGAMIPKTDFQCFVAFIIGNRGDTRRFNSMMIHNSDYSTAGQT